MCGICGIVDFTRLQSEEDNIRAMVGSLAHRGPDDSGCYTAPHVALGHTRLAIIDLKSGHQPMESAAGKHVLVFNGEIYNYVELRKELAGRGYNFRTQSDTEVLLTAYLEWNRGLLDHLVGDFAFALWDQNRKELFAARDRLGLKPFYYTLVKGKLIFASEVKALLTHPEVPRPAVDQAALSNYLFSFYLLKEKTLFAGVSSLQAGHYLNFNAGGLTTMPYWDIPCSTAGSSSNPVAKTEELIEDAVGLQLRSDVKLGITLSGGLDSSIVSIAAARRLKGQLNTYTASYQENVDYFRANPVKTIEGMTGDDTYYAGLLAGSLGTNHTDLIFNIADMGRDLRDVIWHREKPPLVASEFAHFNLSRVARDYVTVLLTGQGGDEIFGGYYYWTERRTAANTHFFPWIMRTADGRNNPLTAYDWMTFLLRPELAKDSSVFINNEEELFRSYLAQAPAEDFRDKMLYMLLKVHLQELLDVEDRLSMASSMEIRCPLCDHRIVEYIFSLPYEEKCRKNIEKYLLRESFATLLPKEIKQRQKSQFPIPLQMEALYQEILTKLASAKLWIHQYFSRNKLERLIRKLESNRNTAARYTAFRLYNLEIWHELFLGTGGRSA